MRRRKTPEEVVAKQIARAQQAAPEYIAGVQGVTESPNAKAAAKSGKYAAATQEAVTSGRYQQANMEVGLDGWKQPTVEKGGIRYAPGVAAAKPKLLKFRREYGPVQDAIADNVRSMSNDTFDQRMARMEANARALHDQPYKGRKKM